MSIEAMKLALVALELPSPMGNYKAITALRQAIAAAEQHKQAQKPEGYQEPVAYPEGDVVGPCICGSWPGGKCLKCPRIAPPQRQWVGLTDEEMKAVCAETWSYDPYVISRAIEAKLKEKNT